MKNVARVRAVKKSAAREFDIRPPAFRRMSPEEKQLSDEAMRAWDPSYAPGVEVIKSLMNRVCAQPFFGVPAEAPLRWWERLRALWRWWRYEP